MTMDARTLGGKIARKVHKGLKSAEQFWFVVAEEVVRHLRERLDLAEIVNTANVTASTYTVGADDEVVLVYTVNSAGSRTVSLPSGTRNGHVICVKDAGGFASRQNITVHAGNAGIDGAASVVLNTDWASVCFTFEGGSWFSFAGQSEGGVGPPGPPGPEGDTGPQGPAGEDAKSALIVSGYGVGDTSGWAVIGRCRFKDIDLGEDLALYAECEASADGVPGEVALFDVTDGEGMNIGTVANVTTDSPVGVKIHIPTSGAPSVDRVLELRARVNGGVSGDKCIVWASYIGTK